MSSKSDLYHPDGSGRVVDVNGTRSILDSRLPIAWPDYSVLTQAQSEACAEKMRELAEEEAEEHYAEGDEPPDAHREWELDGLTHRTEADAFAVAAHAKMGAHVAATDKYLMALRVELHKWINEIEAELLARDSDRAYRKSQ